MQMRTSVILICVWLAGTLLCHGADGAPGHEPDGKPTAPAKAEIGAGRQTFVLLDKLGGEPHAGVEVMLMPAWPGGRPLRAVTNGTGKAMFKAAEGNYLMLIKNRAVGTIDVRRNAKWTSCTIILPKDLTDPPAGRPALRPSIVDGALVLTAEQAQ